MLEYAISVFVDMYYSYSGKNRDKRSIRLNKIIAIANQKGGVGKSTTAINLSSCLAVRGKSVLLIDMDPQGNTTSGFGIDKSELRCSVYDVLMGNCSINDSILSLEYPQMDLIPAEADLAGAEIELIELEDKEFRLKGPLDLIADKYEYIIIDCPPSLSILTVNCLTAARSILIPMQAEFLALEGLALLINTVDIMRSKLNPDLTIEGILFTMFDSRTKLSQEIVENVRSNLNVRIYETTVPRNVRLAEAPSYGMPINLYDHRSKGAKSYEALADEIIATEVKDG